MKVKGGWGSLAGLFKRVRVALGANGKKAFSAFHKDGIQKGKGCKCFFELLGFSSRGTRPFPHSVLETNHFAREIPEKPRHFPGM